MARIRANNASGGGGGINPQVVWHLETVGTSATKQTTIDLSKKYILYITYHLSSGRRNKEYYINNGSDTELYTAGDNNTISIAISGTTLTVSWTVTAYGDIVLTQLD